MTRDDVEKVAFEAGLLYNTGKFVCGPPLDNLGKFAALVAAAEREACAKVCDQIAADRWALYKGRPPYNGSEDGRACQQTQGESIGAEDCATAIRARGEK